MCCSVPLSITAPHTHRCHRCLGTFKGVCLKEKTTKKKQNKGQLVFPVGAELAQRCQSVSNQCLTGRVEFYLLFRYNIIDWNDTMFPVLRPYAHQEVCFFFPGPTDANVSNNNVIIQANVISDGTDGNGWKRRGPKTERAEWGLLRMHICVCWGVGFFSGSVFFWVLCVCKRISQSLH